MREENYFKQLKEKEPKINNMDEIRNNILLKTKERIEYTVIDNYVLLTLFSIYVCLYFYSSITGAMTVEINLLPEISTLAPDKINLLTFVIPITLMLSLPLTIIRFIFKIRFSKKVKLGGYYE
ncbi:MAG: hypothetical protein C0601_00055 [Candidatus Muiribacterium halophilum]|uniref:Uncharacterized protein n=1 Tax=Muiribacterium halophilum TaxID=2053465 RepID=A0A2N5ZNG2_MUIH1|nr:MAG: hypothetical protein C0601_00055 [Candidatus Muirbacterium halophilum]